METTHADLVDRGRHEIEVTFVTRQGVDCGGERIHRLSVTDTTGTRFALLVAPTGDPAPDLTTGERYRVSGLLGAAPVDGASHDDPPCPAWACDGDLRRGQAVDAAGRAVVDAVTRFDITDQSGIVDAGTVVRRAGQPSAADELSPGTGPERPAVPDYVCTACSRHVDRQEADGTSPSAALDGSQQK
jgi:hypothetical protein